jgi:hypothetical protein
MVSLTERKACSPPGKSVGALLAAPFCLIPMRAQQAHLPQLNINNCIVYLMVAFLSRRET